MKIFLLKMRYRIILELVEGTGLQASIICCLNLYTKVSLFCEVSECLY
jgi:hypothetical protein